VRDLQCASYHGSATQGRRHDNGPISATRSRSVERERTSEKRSVTYMRTPNNSVRNRRFVPMSWWVLRPEEVTRHWSDGPRSLSLGCTREKHENSEHRQTENQRTQHFPLINKTENNVPVSRSAGTCVKLQFNATVQTEPKMAKICKTTFKRKLTSNFRIYLTVNSHPQHIIHISITQSRAREIPCKFVSNCSSF
jgi:hypothetical protein